MLHTPRATRAVRALLLTVVAVALAGTGRPLGAQQGMRRSLRASGRDVAGYALSVDKAKRLVSTSGELSRLLAADPAFHAVADGATGQGLTAQAAALGTGSSTAAALWATGFSAHDYAVGSWAFRGAEAVVQMQARGRPVPPAMRSMFPASAVQVAFVSTRQAELDAIALAHRSHGGWP